MELAKQRDFDGALAILDGLSKLPGREYERLRKSAQNWAANIQRRRDRYQQRFHEAGQRYAAEGKYEQAINLWEQLPEGYEDVAKKMDLARKAIKKGESLLQQANTARAEGDLQKATYLLGELVRLRKADKKLQASWIKLKNKLGNLSLMRRYVEQARRELTKENFVEAKHLCERALDLKPGDRSAKALLEEAREKQRKAAETAKTVFIRPRPPAPRPGRDRHRR